jgi:hypothetical protein
MIPSQFSSTMMDADHGNAVRSLHNAWHYGKGKKLAIDLEKHKTAIGDFVLVCCSTLHCKDVYSQKETSCTCLSSIVLTEEEIISCTFYMFNYARLKPSEKQNLVTEWVRYAQIQDNPSNGAGHSSKGCHFVLSGTRHLVCQHAVANLLGMKRSSWQTLAQSVSKNTPIKHGLSGLTGFASNRSNKNHQDLIHSFFKQLEAAAAP